ncbi:MAG TPA: dephospho-CoA kinase [Rhodanobacteraceae bacterium]|nr:dephospho-CoA kinase [Rhodanobacteraceae bacterium]
MNAKLHHGKDRHHVIALTGGVAAGKSAVSKRFEALGVAVYDADVAARQVVAPGTPGLEQIARALGREMLRADGSLDRRAMRERVFADPVARTRLESIIHPRVRAWLREKVAADRGAYCMLAIPLLVENRAEYDWVDRVLLVDAPEALQVERLVRRDGVTREHAQQMLAAQSTRAQRLEIADDVVLNDGEEAALDAQVQALHARYLELCRLG